MQSGSVGSEEAAWRLGWTANPIAHIRNERGAGCDAFVEGAGILPRRPFWEDRSVTDESAPLVVELPEDWFLRVKGTFEALQLRAERAERELAQRDLDLEMRERDLAEKGEQLREAWRSANEKSQTLMAQEHEVKMREDALRAEQEALDRDAEDLSRARQAFEGERREVARREEQLTQMAADLAAREKALADLREHAPTPAESAPPLGPSPKTLERLMVLQEIMEAATEQFLDRDEAARSALATAAKRASELTDVERRVREEEARLTDLRTEIVNASRALQTVDDALARMPYEVVDEFTKRSEFDAYERAVRKLRDMDAPAVD